MGFVEQDFAGGVAVAHGLHIEEWKRRQAARERFNVLRKDGNQPQEDLDEALNEMDPADPLWQQICGFSPQTEILVEPGERRAGIRRLLRVFERMFRSELKAEDIDADGGPSKLDDAVSYAGRSALWDPLNEICLYLEISKAKLNALSVQRTGLRAADMGDCIRAEKLRGHLREKLGPLAWQWFGQLEPEQKIGLTKDLANTAWRLLKWVRGGGRGETRKKLAFELGLTSREKLDRAVLIDEGEALEAVEVGIAVTILREMLMKGNGSGKKVPPPDFLGGYDAHGAECDEVRRTRGNGEPPPEEGGEEERETA